MLIKNELVASYSFIAIDTKNGNLEINGKEIRKNDIADFIIREVQHEE
jgi:hypothetical protein